MPWQQKTVIIFIGAIFCFTLLRVADSPKRPVDFSASAKSADAVKSSPTRLAAIMPMRPRDAAPAENFVDSLQEFFSTPMQLPTAIISSNSKLPIAEETPKNIGQIASPENRQLLHPLPGDLISPNRTDRRQNPNPAPKPLPESADRRAKSAAIPQPSKQNSYHEEWALVTAYCPCARCCGARAHGRTSLGTNAWVPGIAADPRALAYGTKVAVPGYGIYAIDDTGGAMRRNWNNRGILHIDVRMKWHHDARDWGKRWMKIRVYDRPN